MSPLTHLFENSKRGADEFNMEKSSLPQLPYSPPTFPQSPRSTTASSSYPASPSGSLFSTRTHSRFPSSGSSVASSPGTGSLTMKTHLAEVKEEPQEREVSHVGKDHYFPYFNAFHAADNVRTEPSNSLDSFEYHLSMDVTDAGASPKNRLSDNQHFKSISRIGSRLSSMSSKWKQKQQLSDTAAALERYDESLRSRASSTTSTLVGPPIKPLSRRESIHSPSSPRRAVLEEQLSEASLAPLDIDLANSEENSPPEVERHATTPLLPPVSVEFPNPNNEDVPLDSPLESPTVVDTSESPIATTSGATANKGGELPSPPISAHPSMSSINRKGIPIKTRGMDLPPTFVMDEPVDEWSHKLGHANFTIIPQPYTPSASNAATLEEHKSTWELARCNFAKHLVRTGEHYGLTSHIYKMTEEKWESINDQWRKTHNQLAVDLADDKDNPMFCASNLPANEAIKLPRLHDKEKFPDLGDEDIVGPMTVAPQPPNSNQEKPRKQSFFKILQKLFC